MCPPVLFWTRVVLDSGAFHQKKRWCPRAGSARCFTEMLPLPDVVSSTRDIRMKSERTDDLTVIAVPQITIGGVVEILIQEMH